MSDTSLTVDQALLRAIEHHRAGRMPEAEKIYRAILQLQPNHPDANHNLGLLAVKVGKPEAALPLFNVALAAHPEEPQFWVSFIDAQIRTGQLDAARQSIVMAKAYGVMEEKLRAIEGPLVPTVSRDDQLQIVELYRQKRFAEMEVSARDLTQRYPADSFGWETLAPALKNQKKFTEANAAYHKALDLAPDSAMTLVNFAEY